MNREKLLAYIKGEITSEKEITEIVEWTERSAANQQTYTELKNLWVLSGLENRQEISRNEIRPVRKKVIALPKMVSWFTRYAAVFVIAFLLGGLTLHLVSKNRGTNYHEIFNEVKVPKGERSVLYLYDGTKVWLNSGTTLKYPVTFNTEERKVYVDGEAFFDVAKRKHQPFIVRCGRLDVKVFGTRFNVCAYRDDDQFYVTLEEGSVKAVDNRGQAGISLIPGEQAAFYRKTSHFTREKVDPELYSSWKENLLRFEDASFAEVIKKMERWYDVQITLDPSINAKEHYTMTIKTESLREMLNLLKKTTDMNYEIKEDKVLITKP